MPPFSVAELRQCVPPHLFERSLVKSSAYLLRDVAMIGLLGLAATSLFDAPWWLQGVLWPVYFYLQGAVFCGVWIIAHECGHQSFSGSKAINDAVGLVLHSALLVPYHPWRISHSAHHKHTNHADLDQAFVPKARSQVREAVLESPLVTIARIAFALTVGWWGYFFFNWLGRDYGERRVNHFEPSSPIFKPKDRADVVASNAALVVVVAALAAWAFLSPAGMLLLYFAPYMVCNAFLVTITLLQHTDVKVPHFRGDEFTFIRGALSTVDRSYGALLNNLHHNISDSHVAHHLFSTMPHYNAILATPYLQAKLGAYYRRDDSSVLRAAYNVFRDCLFIEDAPAKVLVWKGHKDFHSSSS
jgi:omega-6 fatty acid desaturase / acyl-lipid omega-6 desaturase (Delta-12 desaturase)